ncbi:hypothetical protein [Bradyrhizobium sp. SZCCHNRI20481]|uniref:hypothetical protein n=1 Tax=Bradyrhizobium sp. SZCCHNRI20481 TaxID=3057286 RepID=UPI0029170117|nr:hypothetical protein [Bradyrhizobium sp. SZCCHNRI20481]
MQQRLAQLVIGDQIARLHHRLVHPQCTALPQPCQSIEAFAMVRQPRATQQNFRGKRLGAQALGQLLDRFQSIQIDDNGPAQHRLSHLPCLAPKKRELLRRWRFSRGDMHEALAVQGRQHLVDHPLIVILRPQRGEPDRPRHQRRHEIEQTIAGRHDHPRIEMAVAQQMMARNRSVHHLDGRIQHDEGIV